MRDISRRLTELVQGHDVDALALATLLDTIRSRQVWICEVLAPGTNYTLLIEASTEEAATKELIKIAPVQSVFDVRKLTNKVTKIC